VLSPTDNHWLSMDDISSKGNTYKEMERHRERVRERVRWRWRGEGKEDSGRERTIRRYGREKRDYRGQREI